MMTEIAFLGLGAMGSRMAANLLKHRHSVTVWNRTETAAQPLLAAGARTAPTPRAAVAGAAFAIAMLRDDDASRQVWLDDERGALAGLAPGAVVIESSTVTPAWSRDLARQVQSRGHAFLEAPVAGSRPQAEAAQLIFLAGGEASTLADAEPILRCMGAAVHHAGAVGAGALLKLSVNALLGVQVAAWAELIAMLKRADLDVAHAVEIIGATPVASPAGKANAALMLAEKFAPLFPVELIEKDLGYTTGLADGEKELPLVEATRSVFRRALAAGLGADNMTAVLRLYQG